MITIETAQWNKRRDGIIVNGVLHIPWPCMTWHRASIEAWLAAGNSIAEQPVPTFEEVRAKQEQKIRSEGSRRLAMMAKPYQDEERETWIIQANEAEALIADPETLAPMLRALAALRGIELADLVTKVIGNANLFRVASGQILGQQQALLDALYAAEDGDMITEINWPHTITGG
jgi:hypothetical protein